jgi:hypothetical protein
MELPPPGLGLTTVTEAVDALAMSDSRTAAVNWKLLTKVVGRGLPFQFTTEAETNPAPFTVRVNPAPPGAVASGTSGWFVNGTGFCAMAAPANTVRKPRSARNRAKALGTRMLGIRWRVMDDLLSVDSRGRINSSGMRFETVCRPGKPVECLAVVEGNHLRTLRKKQQFP